MKEKSKVIIEKRNNEFFLRPRFVIDLEESKETVLNRFSKSFKSDEIPFRGSIVDGHIFISVPKKEEHFWSPQLHLEIIEKSEQKALLKGLFGPKPQVWTLFIFIHFVIGVSFLGFCVLLYTKISLNEAIFFPVVMMVALPCIWMVLYFLGKIGKETGKPQMEALHNFMIQII
ncbi:GTP-binding protein [uncultured Polaribacter sp.]|uniref:GTP-binding protein n=1 Tax=uncultured Polaribacter sp. TaxID=174711 RepID=UPI0026091F66|nr:GTP-binding protein [uncultured Polaribacter sp.]